MRTAGLFALAILFPAFAHAAVSITEIMYDLSGADTGREWVEITNTGGSSVDVGGYKFFEANTNHALTLISGTGVLQSGSSAIIADDSTKFKIDWPDYSGILFDSSFSLSNTGESLALKDGALVTLDSVSYDPSLGATGDGHTLQWNGSAFGSAAPTPGTYTGVSDASDSDTSSDAASTTAEVAVSTSGGGPTEYLPIPMLRIVIGGDRVVSSGADVPFTAVVYDGKGNKRDDALVIWSFGDGMRRTGASVFHAYYDPGEYIAVVRVSTPDGGNTLNEIIVTVKDASIKITSVTSRGIALTNNDSRTLDVSLWRLSMGGKEFKIPEDTQILAGRTILFPSQVIELPAASSASLLYPNGEVAATYPGAITATVPSSQPFIPQTSFNKMQTVESPAVSIVEPITSAKTNIQEDEKAVLAPAAATELAAAGAALPPDNSRASRIFKSPWTLGFLGIIALAGSAFIFL